MPRVRKVDPDQAELFAAENSVAPKKSGNGRAFASQQSLASYIWSTCDILRRSNCAGALQYVPELTWILFLRILDEREAAEAAEAEAVGVSFIPSLVAPYRWRDWAAPDGHTRIELQMGAMGGFFNFVNGKLLPYLRALKDQPNANSRQKVISEIMSGVERVGIDTEKNTLDVLDKVHQIKLESVDDTHIFALSQVYEGLLLKMGEKGNDGGQFFTPREIIRAMVRVVDPRIGETLYDPACGTGGFLAQSYEYMRANLGDAITAEQIDALARRTFYGREKENLVYPIALANLVLHGINQPNLWHGNTLTGGETYGGLFQDAPSLYDVVLTNPPFGGREGKEAQTNFAYKTGATQVLFLQHVINSLKPGGRCGIVLDEGVLFRTNETAFVQTKRKLLDDCDLWCIVSLPGGVFNAAGAGVKTNLLFFTKGKKTDRIWYYDLSDIKVGKKTPFTVEKFGDFFELLKTRADSPRSWTVDRKTIIEKNYDLKAVNPNARDDADQRTPEELLAIIDAKGREVEEALAPLRRGSTGGETM
jgi:type I restriction enzyme M protein